MLIEHQLVPSLKKADIKTITLSDHAPVVIQLEISGGFPVGKNWKWNNLLIQDPETIKKIEQELERFFAVNDILETPSANFVRIT